MINLISNSCNLIKKIFNFKSVICLCSLWILIAGHTPQQEHELLLLDALGRRHSNNNNNNYGDPNSLMDILGNSNSFLFLIVSLSSFIK